jgi:hypothetical protein
VGSHLLVEYGEVRTNVTAGEHGAQTLLNPAER